MNNKEEIMLKNSVRLSSAAGVLLMLLALSGGETHADDSVAGGSVKNLMTLMDKNVPLEDSSESDESKLWSAELSLGLNMTSGNSNTLSSNMSFSESRKI
jgi:hypothetical protein